MTEVPLTTAEISDQVKRRQKPVNQGYSLDAYFAVADSTGVTVRAPRPRQPPRYELTAPATRPRSGSTRTASPAHRVSRPSTRAG